MWINKQFFEMVLADNKRLQDAVEFEKIGASRMSATAAGLREQKAKDDITIDWMRHRVNALEKEKGALLLAKGVHLPVPEIVPTRPGSVSSLPDFSHMPSFEDVGDEAATRLGLVHDEHGHLTFKDTVGAQLSEG